MPSLHKELHPHPQPMRIIKCQVLIINASNPLRVGFTGVMLCHTAKIPMTIIAILNKVDRKPVRDST
jgi:translation elongation factor EF-1alpha